MRFHTVDYLMSLCSQLYNKRMSNFARDFKISKNSPYRRPFADGASLGINE